MADLGRLLPLFPLDVVLMPGAPLPLHIFEPRYRKMIGQAIRNESEFGILMLRENDLATVGTTALVEKVTHRYEDGRFDIETRGVRRFRVRNLDESEEFLQGEIEFFDDEQELPVSREEAESLYLLTVEAAALAGAPAPKGLDPEDPHPSFRAAAGLPLDLAFKQKLLTSRSERQRLAQLAAYLKAWIEKAHIATKAKAVAGRNGHARKLDS
jgi:Lon protease-like protein